VAGLSDKAGVVRAAAATALVGLGDPGAKQLNRTHTIFSDSDALVRRASATALKFGAVDANLHGSLLLRDNDASVRAAAVTALSERGDMSQGAASKVAIMIQDSEATIRAAAARALQKMNPAGVRVPSLAKLLKDRNEDVQDACTYALAHHGVRGAESVSFYLEDPDPDVRSYAAIALGRIGEEAAPFAEMLIRCLYDSECRVRASSRFALQHLGNTVINAVVELLGDPDAVVRDEAVQVLAGMGKAGAAAAAQRLGDRQWQVRQAAVDVMCYAQSQASAAHAVEISALLFDDTFRVRWSAVKALTCLGEVGCAHAASHLKVDNSRPLDLLHDEAAARHAADLISNKDPVVRRCAVEALGDSGPAGIAYAALVADCLEDENGQVQWAAAEALAAMGEDGVTYAGKKLHSSNGLARRAAIEVLGSTGELGAKCSASLMRDEDPNIRRLAAEAIGKTGTLAGRENAVALGPLLLDEDCSVRWMAASSLAVMGQTGADLAADLLDHYAEEVRHAAVDALGRIGWLANVHAEKIAVLCKKDRDWQVKAKAHATLMIFSQGGPAEGTESKANADWSGAQTDEGKRRMREIQSLLPEPE
jgi:HEAT repeat protein